MIRALIIVGILALTGCSKFTDPVWSCSEKSDYEICGRGGCTKQCVKYSIGCNDPLVLSEKNGVLECHLPEAK